MSLKNRDVISIDDFSREELVELIEFAGQLKRMEEQGNRYSLSTSLKNRRLACLFYEPSTRTRNRFVTAMRELGGSANGFSGTEMESVKKRESVFFTTKMYEANHFDAIVMRHPRDGSAQWFADCADVPVINGGDGSNEHPTQTMLDLFTIHEALGGIDNTHIGFGGDLKYGRTVHSLPLGLSKFNNVTIHLAPIKGLEMSKQLIDELKKRGLKVKFHGSLTEVLETVGVFYMTRPQLERMQGVDEKQISDLMEQFRISLKLLASLKNDVKIMHPLPIDSKIEEIKFDVVFSKNQYFIPQAQNGVFLTKALIYKLLVNSSNELFRDSFVEQREDYKPNNIIRIRMGKEKHSGRMYVDKIRNGVSLDHISAGKGHDIVEALELDKRKFLVTIGMNLPSKRFGSKDIVKISDVELNQRIIKKVLMISPYTTFNVIKNGKVADKFLAVVCDNDNCVTRVIEEDVPPKFEIVSGNPGRLAYGCHYCRQMTKREF